MKTSLSAATAHSRPAALVLLCVADPWSALLALTATFGPPFFERFPLLALVGVLIVHGRFDNEKEVPVWWHFSSRVAGNSKRPDRRV